MSRGTILFIDAYDSFSNNITSLLRHELGVTTETIKIDDARFVLNDDAFYSYIRRFDAVVAGPGPGHPGISHDVGLMASLWQLSDSNILPVLGVCLGFQSLCTAFGAQTQRLTEPRHGIVTRITHASRGIFRIAPQHVAVTQYHSLQMLLDDQQQDAFWSASTRCPQLSPLAWDLNDVRNGPILMAVQHVHKPFTGVQFHPESICTSMEGRNLVSEWWQQACAWNATHRVHVERPLQYSLGSSVPSAQGASKTPSVSSIALPNTRALDAIAVVEHLRPHLRKSPLVLQSGTRGGQPLNQETGRYSILGFHDGASTHIRYSCQAEVVSVLIEEKCILSRQASTAEAFEFLEAFVGARKVDSGPSSIPFWGGLVGYITYEAGLTSIGVEPSATSAHRPDMWFVFVERSLVIDHVENVIYIQSIATNDMCWLHEMAALLHRTGEVVKETVAPGSPPSILSQPQETAYHQKVAHCQSYLKAGSSYELCLTEQTVVRSDENSWAMYRRLSTLNPAPFGAYMHVQDARDAHTGVAIVGSSPERFLQWSRDGRCQFRPIKGTVSKVNGVTRAEAEAVLRSQKEMAENLMIVDLIRHDLAGVDGVHKVRVPSLMAVEEYETVFQLVSVIEGDLDNTRSGTAVLAASLPPGSMTGAPKKRSCELLKTIEDDVPRGIYSGVLGYMDVGGGGDFSVVIRTAFRWHEDNLWRVGAGGAVTILSTPQGEYDEMLVKRQRVLDVILQQQSI